ncbi:CusA/CzcA family heavy metal efflux RND transporter [Rhodanobacter sp. T12-5]|jgi:cobalt-zinc-cadmium resistance protein CzcA|uniref:efflux RND transporter permease subunit n=1 Tax=Rhodanobacter sp. T12-5 TaxID=2024611 RepID=UPI0012558B2B|nr:CusA/CzcA family heavy metal efflux RND transporter [Rhodanobacter sp. T12-5]KAA0072236.1 efflux RND transporter permease subunit [Rhodanobacter sp. T12-5]HTH68826.1 CusA/CzcA family heavy metal efflux RND transporter [Rhodanobacter sp.]
MSDPLPPTGSLPRQASIMNRIVAAALAQRFITVLLTLLLIGAGAWALKHLPMDAYPDLSPPMVDIVTQWPGHTAEEVERLITVPVELGMNGVPQTTAKRSVSLYGLSDVVLTFKDGTDNYFARQQVINRMGDLGLPDGVTPSMSPLSAPSGLIYRYVLQSPDRSPMELKTLEDWTVAPQYRSVPGVADDSSFGGGTMQYQVLLDQAKVAALGLSVAQVEASLTANNSNAGGGFYSQGGQFYYVRGLGRIDTLDDIRNVVLAVHDGTPILLKDVGRVVIGTAPRLGEFGFEKQDDAVEGVILMRKGEKTQDVLTQVEAKTKELNEHLLPKDVKIHVYYDLSDLIAQTTKIVEQNLLRGMVLVIVVLVFFLYDFRAGLIVAVTIPLALLFAFFCLDLRGASANLLSIGAVDFGILVDGAIFMVENIFRQIAAREGAPVNIREIIQDAAAEVDRPLFYAVAVIVASFLPIYVLSGPSGTLFKPMADTMILALIGSLVVTLTLLPVLCSWFMRKGVRERRNRAFEAIKSAYTRGLDFCLARPWGTTLASGVLLLASLLLVPHIGAEFMPQLDEGALWVRATMPYTISIDESAKIAPKIREILGSFPEVTVVASELGRPDDGTDSTGFFNAEFFVGLKPYSQWTGAYRTKPELIKAIDKKLEDFPGITFNYTQPAEDAVDEAETGLKSALAVKVFGPDLATLQQKGKAVKQVLEKVRGITDVTLVQELGQPSLTIKIDRAKIARYGLNVDDINGLIQTAIGGDVATQVVQGEKQFDLVVRLDQQYRDNPDEIGNIRVATPGGQQIPLKELADIGVTNGASFIYREDNSRYIGVQFSVQGRDLAGAVEDAMQKVDKQVPLAQGYRLDWGGEYKEYTASRAQLNLILPLTLGLIFLLLFSLYNNVKFPLITVLGVLLSAPFGGIVALWLTGTPFSVSSGIGFLALFGVSVLTAVVYISYVNELRRNGTPLADAIREGAILRLRPIMMTALVAALGLLPAALATGVGTDSQRPFALVIVCGMLSRLLISIFLMPALYALVARPDDRLEV